MDKPLIFGYHRSRLIFPITMGQCSRANLFARVQRIVMVEIVKRRRDAGS